MPRTWHSGLTFSPDVPAPPTAKHRSRKGRENPSRVRPAAGAQEGSGKTGDPGAEENERLGLKRGPGWGREPRRHQPQTG